MGRGAAWIPSFRRRRLRGEGVGDAVAAIEGDEVVHRQFLGTADDGERGARVGVAEEQAVGGEADALAVVGEQNPLSAKAQSRDDPRQPKKERNFSNAVPRGEVCYVMFAPDRKRPQMDRHGNRNHGEPQDKADPD